jgi:formylglycine-generating enzyme required for sulfatase activity
VLLGGPGSGKTTFLNFVALCLAGERLRLATADLKLLRTPIPPEPDDDDSKKPQSQRWRHKAPLPVRVVLRDFAADLPPAGAPITADTLWAFIVKQLPDSLRRHADDLQAELLSEEGGLILLDVDHLRFAAVPRGPFWMGEPGDERAELHCNAGLDYDYWIAQTPVTVAQFRQFVAASGYDAHHPDCLRASENRPVVWVTWHDARAFCAWLGHRWREQLPAGWSVGLPSEAEWEKAARGGTSLPVPVQVTTVGRGFSFATAEWRDNPLPQRAYPWGGEFVPDHANCEGNVGAASTPGCFERGRSPYGCEDLSGNVWEWTRSLWSQDWREPEFGYPYGPDDANRENLAAEDDVHRVLRGGSWDLRRAFARCASRFWFRPNIRYDFGFRVVLGSVPVG